MQQIRSTLQSENIVVDYCLDIDYELPVNELYKQSSLFLVQGTPIMDNLVDGLKYGNVSCEEVHERLYTYIKDKLNIS